MPPVRAMQSDRQQARRGSRRNERDWAGLRSSSSTERVGRPRPREHPKPSLDCHRLAKYLTAGRAILRRMTEGHVIIIGGAEDKVRERVILSRFVKLAGGA